MLAAAQFAAGRTEQAAATLAPIVATCAEFGLTFYLVDGYPEITEILRGYRDDLVGGNWPADRSAIPLAFLDRAIDAGIPSLSGYRRATSSPDLC